MSSHVARVGRDGDSTDQTQLTFVKRKKSDCIQHKILLEENSKCCYISNKGLNSSSQTSEHCNFCGINGSCGPKLHTFWSLIFDYISKAYSKPVAPDPFLALFGLLVTSTLENHIVQAISLCTLLAKHRFTAMEIRIYPHIPPMAKGAWHCNSHGRPLI